LSAEAQVIKCVTALSIGMEKEDHTQESQAEADQEEDHLQDLMEEIEIVLVKDKITIIIIMSKEIEEIIEITEIIEIIEIIEIDAQIPEIEKEIIVIEDQHLEIVEEHPVALLVEADLEMDQENQEEGIQDQDHRGSN